MKSWLPALLLACVLGGGLWYFTRAPAGKFQAPAEPNRPRDSHLARGMSPSSPHHGPTGSAPTLPGGEPGPSRTVSITPASTPAAPERPFILGSADTPPSMDAPTVLSNMRVTINQYRSMFGENPVGTNQEITRALNGDNPRQARFIREEQGLRINGRGELVDYWGTPFFFHQLSGTEMEIHSAGPDKVMWTADDLVTK